MGGGDGVIITKDGVKTILGEPIVSGSLPLTMRAGIQQIVAKDVADWTTSDSEMAARAIHWMLCSA